MPLSFFGGTTGGGGAAIPFARTVEPSQLGMLMNLEQAELLRIQRYNEAWRLYFGKHWNFKREDGEPLVTFNYFRKIIDKSVAFLVAKGFVNQVPEALEEVSKPFLDEVWEYNKRDQFAWDSATTGGVTGDVFAMVTFEDPSPMQKKLNPFSEGHVRVNLLGSEQSFPTWDPLNTDTLLAFRIETIYFSDRGAGFGTDDNGSHEGRQLNTKRFTQIITRDQIIEQFHGEQPVIRPNLLMEIPVVHIKNMSLPKEYYGLPDGMDLVDVQRELNEKSTDISDTINYHCVDTETEALTKRGWKKFNELRADDEILSLDASSDEITWQALQKVHVYENVKELVEWDNRISAVTTANHRWLVEKRIGRPENRRYERGFARTSEAMDGDPGVPELRDGSRLILGGGTPTHFRETEIYDTEVVETIGWLVTEGCVMAQPSGAKTIILAQSEKVNSSYVEDIRRLQKYWKGKGHTFTEQAVRASGVVCWYLGTELAALLLDIAPNKSLQPSFLTSLTHEQAATLLAVLVAADGTVSQGSVYWYQDDAARVDGFQMLAAMLDGARTVFSVNNRGNGVVYVHQKRATEALATVNRAKTVRGGTVWCPQVSTGVWFARRKGFTYWTGNSAPVTVIYGAKAKQLERGPRQIWSGLPEKARVETLKLEGDLTAAKGYVDFVKKVLHELSDTPEGALGAMQPISNTSGVALHMQYQPLIEKTRRKKAQYEPGFEQINYFILRVGMVAGLISLPFDLCKHCGGRIVEVETGKTTRVWNPDTQSFVVVPIRKKRCYHVDKQTLEFTDPYEMLVKYWRQYGFGSELREMPLRQVIEEIKEAKRSFWDYTVVADAMMEVWRANNAAALQDAHTTTNDNMPTETVDPATGAPIQTPSATPQALVPQIIAPPPQLKPPPMLMPHQLPDGDIEVPEEPETVTTTRQWANPDTGEVLDITTEEIFAVPTGCRKPAYLNPFENKVEFNDVLPKDEALQAQLYKNYLDMNLVDTEWVQSRIPEIAASATEIRRRMKKQQAILDRMKPTMTQQYNPGTGATTTFQGDLAPAIEEQATVPGAGGNPVPVGQQLGGG